MRLSAVVLSLCAALAVASPVPDPDAMPAPVPDIDWTQVIIESINYAGTGCPAGSVAITKASDWQTVTIAFDKYVAGIGPGVAFSERRKNCNINIKLRYPNGLQYTMYKTDYSGYADLQKAVRATQQSDYWFAGFIEGKATLKSTWVGPFTNTYSFSDTLLTKAYVWSPCGATTTLNINTQLWLENSQNPKGSGFITTDVIDHKVQNKHLHYLSWRTCK